MSRAKIAISIDKILLQKVDHLVDIHMFKNRSQAIQGVIYKSLGTPGYYESHEEISNTQCIWNDVN